MGLPQEIDTLVRDLVWAFYDLDEYKVLYSRNRLQQKLMNETARHFFTSLWLHYWDRFSMVVRSA